MTLNCSGERHARVGARHAGVPAGRAAGAARRGLGAAARAARRARAAARAAGLRRGGDRRHGQEGAPLTGNCGGPASPSSIG